MQKSNAGYLRYLHRCQTLILLVFFVVSPFILRGQSIGRGNYNFLDFQNRNYYFGITLGYNQSDYRIYRGKNFVRSITPDSIIGLNTLRGPGFNLQIISNLRVGDYFDLRFLPGFSFVERNIDYDYLSKNKPDRVNKIESVLVELPFQVRYKSAPYRDKRAFVMAGIKYSYDIQSKSRSRQSSTIPRISPTDYQAEVGVGLQMFFPYFIFSPEIKFSHGLGNILIYSPASDLRGATNIEKLMSRTFTVSLHFEG